MRPVLSLHVIFPDDTCRPPYTSDPFGEAGAFGMVSPQSASTIVSVSPPGVCVTAATDVIVRLPTSAVAARTDNWDANELEPANSVDPALASSWRRRRSIMALPMVLTPARRPALNQLPRLRQARRRSVLRLETQGSFPATSIVLRG